MTLTYGEVMSRVGADKLVCVVVGEEDREGIFELHGYEWNVADDSPLRDEGESEEERTYYIALALVESKGRLDAG